MSDRLLRPVAYALEKLAVSRRTLKRLVESGQLAYVDVATRTPTRTDRQGKWTNPELRFLDEDLDAFIARRRVEAVEQPRDEATAQSRQFISGRRPRVPPDIAHLPGARRYA